MIAATCSPTSSRPSPISFHTAPATIDRPTDCRTYRVVGSASPQVSKATSRPPRATATCADGSGPCSTSRRILRRSTSSRCGSTPTAAGATTEWSSVTWFSFERGGFPKASAYDLAVRVARQVVHEPPADGDLEPGQPGAGVASECRGLRWGAGIGGDDEGDDGLAEPLVRYAGDRDVRHCGVSGQDRLHFERVDVLATADDHVGASAEQVEIPVLRHAAQVAAVQPALGVDLEEVVGAGVDLADAVRPGVVDPDLDTGCGPAHRPQQLGASGHRLPVVLRGEHADRRALRLSEHVEHADAGHRLVRPAQGAGADGCATVLEGSQRLVAGPAGPPPGLPPPGGPAGGCGGGGPPQGPAPDRGTGRGGGQSGGR